MSNLLILFIYQDMNQLFVEIALNLVWFSDLCGKRLNEPNTPYQWWDFRAKILFHTLAL